MATIQALSGGEFIIRETPPSDIFIPEVFYDDQMIVLQMV